MKYKTIEELDEEARLSRDLCVRYRYRGGLLTVKGYPGGNGYLIDGEQVTRGQAQEFLSCD